MCNGFVTGRHDYTTWFYCGASLKGWEETDSPCKEHARWKPVCIFVIHIKGLQFVLDNAESLKRTQTF
jgi:hypothetical protein